MEWKEILEQPEGKIIEFKQEFPPDGLSLLKTCIAFANGAGGDLYIGISDKDRKIVGVIIERVFAWEEKLANLVYTSVEPTMAFDFTTLHIEEKTIVCVHIPAGGLKPYYLKSKGMLKGTYIRVGSTNRLATAQILDELHRQRKNISFDMESVSSIDLKDLKSGLFKQYWEMRGLTQLPFKANISQWIKLGFARKNNGSIKPTVAGALFLCEELPEELSQGMIQATRFKGTTMETIIDTKSFSPPLFHQIDATTKFLSIYVEKKLLIHGTRHEELYAYPMDALREAVINAICHRDYAVNASAKVAIFDDRIEITNPGALPGGLLISDLGSGISELRNRVVARVLRETGYIEQLGTGIQRMRVACERQGIPPPLFQEMGLYFKVTLFKEYSGAGIKEDEWKIMNLLKKLNKIRASEVAKLLGVHKNTANYKLNKLVSKGKLVRRGQGPATYYERG